MVLKTGTCYYSNDSFYASSSKSNKAAEVPLVVTPVNQGTLSYYEGYDCLSILSEEELTKLKISYGIPRLFP